MNKFQIYNKDTYGHTSLVTYFNNKKKKEEDSWENLADALEAAKGYVHDINFNNPTVFDEQVREAKCAVVILNEGVYAGSLIQAKNIFLTEKDGEIVSNTLDTKTNPVKFYIGNTKKNEPLFVKNYKKQEVNDFNNEFIRNMELVFVHQVKNKK